MFFFLKLLQVFISASRLLPCHVGFFFLKLALGVRSNGIKTGFVCLKIDVSYFVNEHSQNFTGKYLFTTGVLKLRRHSVHCGCPGGDSARGYSRLGGV